MSSLPARPDDPTNDPTVRSTIGRKRVDRAFLWFCLVVTSIAVLVLMVLLLSIVMQGVGSLRPDFLTSFPSRDPENAGIKAALWGSVWVCTVCALVALPIGVGTAVWLEEFAPRNRLTGLVRLNISNLAGVPSIVYGIIGLTVFARMFYLVGSESDPAFTIGQSHYEAFDAADGGTVYKRVASKAAPTVSLLDGDAVMRIIEQDITRVRSTPVRALVVDDEFDDRVVLVARERVTLRVLTEEDVNAGRGLGPTAVRANDAHAPAIRTRMHVLSEDAPFEAPAADASGATYLAVDSIAGETFFLPREESADGRIEDGASAWRVIREIPVIARADAAEPDVWTDLVVQFGAGGRYSDPTSWAHWRTASGDQVLRTANDGAPLVTGSEVLVWESNDFRELGTERGVARLIADDAEPDVLGLFDVYAIDAEEPYERIPRNAWYFVQVPFGKGVLAGGLTLMLVILPIVIIASVEAIRAVPNSLRDASLAMGATRWQTVALITLPHSIPMIMTGAILAMSRAIGEAAPILVLGVALFITRTPSHLMDQFTILPMQIYNWAGRPQPAFQQIAASGIIVLLAVLLSFNALAVLIRHKLSKSLA